MISKQTIEAINNIGKPTKKPKVILPLNLGFQYSFIQITFDDLDIIKNLATELNWEYRDNQTVSPEYNSTKQGEQIATLLETDLMMNNNIELTVKKEALK